MQFVYLLRAFFLSLTLVFAELSSSKTLSPHRLGFGLLAAACQFWWQERPRLLPVGPPLGRSMRWYLLLIWAQGLRQAPLPASGAVSGRIVTMGNVSAEEGGSVTLQCHLSSTTAKVTQVNWEQQDQLLAVHHANLGWHIYPAFRERVAPGPNVGLTLQSLTRNDTGEYFCTYHTYPDGIYRGTFFLEVLHSSVAEHSAAFQIPLLGAMATVLAVICVAVIMVVTLTRKKSLRVHCAESGLRMLAREQEEWNPQALSSAGSGRQAETAPVGFYTEQRGEDYAEPHDYFNVLSYRSLGSFSFLAEMG
ncbi:T-cell immunoreceptor with Ig and ITIM domains [Callorhinus ursinus]|uniref:T-cell immunoreceptor with Ig and ITIM domains n=1 Tax=Callorhinus ursinus TaxID=34884 RepID=UPI000DEE5AFD|nr:T-cell immunoreceptor with Ig and ITIM domains [Callorhinus ursinus]